MQEFRRIFIVAGLLCLLSACAGGTPTPSYTELPGSGLPGASTAADARQRAALPGLDALRGVSAIDEDSIAPQDRLFSSAGFVIEGPAGFELGRMDATDSDEPEWAIYGLAPPAGLMQQVALTVVDPVSVDPFYIALSDYSTGRWDISGPYSFQGTSFTATLPLDNAVHLSAGVPPTAYFAVISPAGSNIALQGIAVQTLVNDVPRAFLNVNQDFGTAPLVVDFSAVDSTDDNGTIELYEFDFEDDGTFDVSGTAATTQHIYTVAGEFTARLRVTDNDGATGDTTVVIDVNQPPVPALSFLPGNKLRINEPFTLDASASTDSDGSIVLYEWDTDGNTVPDESSTVNTFDSLGIATPGTYNLGVRVTDDQGATATATAELTIYNWNTSIADAAGTAGEYCSLAVVNGHPAISYHDADNGDLKFVRATDANGSAWGTPVTPDSAGITGRYTSLAVVDGNPAISYYDVDNTDLKFVRASDANGSGWGAPTTLDNTGNTGQFTSLAIVNGNPAIGYYFAGNGDLKYIRAADASGGAWSAAVTVDSSGNTGRFASLKVVNGNPALAYQNGGNGDLHYVRSSDSNGTAWGTPVSVDTDGTTGEYLSLAVVNANPAISYHDATNLDLRYVRATDNTGATWGTPLTLLSAGDVGWYTSLAVVGGQPAISFYDLANSDLRYMRATDSNGATWPAAPEIIDNTGLSGHHSSLAVVGGNAAVSYFDITNGDLRFAIDV